MVINFYGAECFKVSFGDTTLGFNPISKKSNLKAVSFGADIALTTLNHPDMNGADQLVRGDKEPFVVSGPGEYEVKDVTIRGVQTKSSYDGEERINTVFLVSLEGMSICFLGAHESKDIPAALKEAIDTVDILFVPIGDEGVLSPKDAHHISVLLEAKVVVPMHYGEVGQKDALKQFLKEVGQEKADTVDKLSIKKKDLEGKEGEVVIIKS